VYIVAGLQWSQKETERALKQFFHAKTQRDIGKHAEREKEREINKNKRPGGVAYIEVIAYASRTEIPGSNPARG
jgi:hypothetical protein